LFQPVPENGTELNPASMRVAGVFFSLCSIVPLKNYTYGGEKFIYNTEKTCCHVLRKEQITASCIFSGTMEHET
jgi:hypothetical protein